MKKIIKNNKSGKELCESCKKRVTCKDYKKKDYPICCCVFELDEGDKK